MGMAARASRSRDTLEASLLASSSAAAGAQYLRMAHQVIQRTFSTEASCACVLIRRYFDYARCMECRTAERALLAIPCGHLYACARCGSHMTQCPVCGEGVVDYMRIFH
jgi:hypothetical protein